MKTPMLPLVLVLFLHSLSAHAVDCQKLLSASLVKANVIQGVELAGASDAIKFELAEIAILNQKTPREVIRVYSDVSQNLTKKAHSRDVIGLVDLIIQEERSAVEVLTAYRAIDEGVANPADPQDIFELTRASIKSHKPAEKVLELYSQVRMLLTSPRQFGDAAQLVLPALQADKSAAEVVSKYTELAAFILHPRNLVDLVKVELRRGLSAHQIVTFYGEIKFHQFGTRNPADWVMLTKLAIDSERSPIDIYAQFRDLEQSLPSLFSEGDRLYLLKAAVLSKVSPVEVSRLYVQIFSDPFRPRFESEASRVLGVSLMSQWRKEIESH